MHSLNPNSFASSNESTSCFTIVLFNFFVDVSSKILIKILLPLEKRDNQQAYFLYTV